MSNADFKIDLSEKFPRLMRSPLVEAVIHWQARAQKSFEPSSLEVALADQLPRYPQRSPMQKHKFLAEFSSEENPAGAPLHAKRFLGYRLSSEDGRDVVQFTRDGLVFSRTKAYEHWEPFLQDAIAAWRVFQAIAAPVEIQRLGVRFINHIVAAKPESLGEFLKEPPTCPTNLPLKEFVYQSTFAVPDQPFGVRVIKVMQPQNTELKQTSGLFIDLDVFRTRSMPVDGDELGMALMQMRWLKNKVFFTLLTEKTVRSFMETES